MTTVYEAELTLIDGQLVPQQQVSVGEDGCIEAIGAGLSSNPIRMARRALLPGFVNAHSHAFQRGLRGRGETFAAGAGSFWSWREAMYELVSDMSRERLGEITRQAFREMRRAGITSVGEFHYLHHLDVEAGDFSGDDVVLEAARDVGIRIVLLQVCYRTGAIDAPLAGGQQRFDTVDLDTYLARLDALAARTDGAMQRVGVVAHSIRAVPLDEIVALRRAADERDLVLHLHVEEQRQEIEACRARYGKTPTALLNHHGVTGPRVTAVHCTHTEPEDMAAYRAAGGQVCLCPLTEANLGDGLADVESIRRGGGGMALGSDSNARISMLEEMRWLEYGQRLRTEQRGICCDEHGSIAGPLLQAATRDGAASLGLPAGVIEAGRYADFTAIDLDHPDLAEVARNDLLAALILGADNGAIASTCVGGCWNDVD